MIVQTLLSLSILASITLAFYKRGVETYCKNLFTVAAFKNFTQKTVGISPLIQTICKKPLIPHSSTIIYGKSSIELYLKPLKGKDGSIEIAGVLFLFCTFLFTLFTYYSLNSTLIQLKERGDAYLCLKKMVRLNVSHTKLITTLNQTILAATLVKFVPTPAGPVASETIIQTASRAQDLELITYLGKISKVHECPLAIRLSRLKNTPFQTFGTLFARTPNNLTIARRNEWKTVIPINLKRREFLTLIEKNLSNLQKSYHFSVSEGAVSSIFSLSLPLSPL